MRIRHATAEDVSAIAEIHVSTRQSAYASILSTDYLASLSVEARQAQWKECLAAGKPELLVAEEGGRIHGWLSFGTCRDAGAADDEAEVWALYVSPALWSTGAGRMLWLRAKKLMLEQGFHSCSLWVLEQNARAIKFYGQAGFARESSPAKTSELGGRKVQEVRLVARLDA